jgi:hypothetical protein
MHYSSNLLDKVLYMFRTCPLSIISSISTMYKQLPTEIAWKIQCVPLATERGISLIILTPMKILQRNLNRGTFVVWEMKRNVSVVRPLPHYCEIIKEMPGSVASGTHCTYCAYTVLRYSWWWTVDKSEICRVLYQINLRNSASRWLSL